MAIYYMDYVNGNDANSGFSWSEAKKTVNGFTAAILIPGDIVRIAKSPDPTSLGQNATWTNVSSTVTLTNAVSATIDMCESGWVGGTGVTATHDSTVFKEGTYSLKLVTDATVTTARKLAYKTLSSTDFSGYKQISFWFNNAATLTDGTLQIKLCSDTLGATPVDTLNIPANALATSHWAPITIDKGSALGAAIQSVAIYSTATYASKTNYFDCIIACKDSTADDSLSLTSLISKNNGDAAEGWYPIQSINGTTIRIDNATVTTPTLAKGYYGATENVPTYKRETIKTTIVDGDAAGFTFTVQDSGLSGQTIQWIGGYDTSTSIRNGETFFDGQSGSSVGMYASAKNFNVFNYLSFARYWYGIYILNGTDNTISNINVIGCTSVGSYNATTTNLICSGYFNCNNNFYGLYLNAPVNAIVNSILNCNNSCQLYATDNNAGGLCLINAGTATLNEVVNANNCNLGVNMNAITATFNGTTINVNNTPATNGVGLYMRAGVLNSVINSNINCNTSLNQGVGVNSTSTGNIFNGTITSVGSKYALYVSSNGNVFNGDMSLTGNTDSGIYFASTPKVVTFNGNITLTGGTQGIYFSTSVDNIKFNKTVTISGTTTGAVVANSTNSLSRNIFFANLVISTPGTYGVVDYGSVDFRVNRGSCSGFSTGAIYNPNNKLYFSDFAITGTPVVNGLAQWYEGAVYISNGFASPNVNRIYVYGGMMQSDDTTRYTASGMSWNLAPTSTDRSVNYPLRLSLAKIAVNANALVTVTAFFRRDHADITGTLLCEGYQVAGVNSDVSASLSGPINNWEQLSITFTPTEQGVVEICALAYGGNSYNVWVDDMSVTQ